jgi:hypothetical protein
MSPFAPDVIAIKDDSREGEHPKAVNQETKSVISKISQVINMIERLSPPCCFNPHITPLYQQKNM